MAPVLDTTVNGAAANSYGTLAEYKSYLEARLPAVTWLATALAGTIDAQLTVDLIVGARLLDLWFQWTGAAATITQARAWGRSGMYDHHGGAIAINVLPTNLKYAQFEAGIAARNSDLLADNEAAVKGVSRVKAGSVEVAFQPVDNSNVESVDTILRRMGPEFGWTRAPGAVRDLLVESWYVRSSIAASRFTGSLEVY